MIREHKLMSFLNALFVQINKYNWIWNMKFTFDHIICLFLSLNNQINDWIYTSAKYFP